MNRNILVIGTNVRNRVDHVMTLAQWGYDVTEVSNFDEAAVLMTQRISPSAVVIDVKFNSDEASEFVSYIRDELRWNDLKIVIVSGQDKGHDIRGADCVLHRPVNENDLLNSIN